jgi:hypothetical protein
MPWLSVEASNEDEAGTEMGGWWWWIWWRTAALPRLGITAALVLPEPELLLLLRAGW